MSELRWSEEQRELGALLRGLLDRHSGSEAVRAALDSPRGYDEELWRLLCEQVGVAALGIPEEHGGAGATFAETAVALEQLGYALAPSPALATAVAAEALLRTGDPDASARLLPGIAAGATATLAWSGASGFAGGDEPVVEEGGALTGEVPLVLDADTAEVLLVAARTADGVGLFEVAPDAPGLQRRATPAVDQVLRLGAVRMAAAPATRVGGEAGEVLRQVHAVAAAAVAALQVGVAQRGLDMTVAYSKERVQFGRPIGSFQALKHRMADMLVQVETARSAAMDAALAIAAGAPPAEQRRKASVAKAWCSDALAHVAAETIQLHGGIAITWEHDAQLVFKRAHALGHLFGAPHLHRRAVLEGSFSGPAG